MKFVKTSPQLTDAVECILHIYERLIIKLGRLQEAEMHESWRQGMIEILEVLESVRPIANRTDTILPMLISVAKYIHWMDNMGLDGIPFPNWKKALFPNDESIAGHPWLLMVECCYDTVGWQLQKPQPMQEQVATTSATTIPILPPSSVEEMEAKSMDNRGDDDLYDDSESEVSDKVAEVDEEVTETIRVGIMDNTVKVALMIMDGMMRMAQSRKQVQRKNPAKLSLPKLQLGQDSKSDLVQENVGQPHDEDLIDLLGADLEVDTTITSGNNVTALQETAATHSCEINSSEDLPTHQEETVAGQDTQPMTSMMVEESGAAIEVTDQSGATNEVTEEQRDTIMEEVN
ncbi:hypothetical protein EDC04DRAFT_2606795 [Pisolithus marmoratus]|nr:hypothetical protein EDC04DRAFT_2606795 [Pisolithus marmoratus]